MILEHVIENYHKSINVNLLIKDATISNKDIISTGIQFSHYIKDIISKKGFPRTPKKMIQEKAIITLEE